MLKAEAHIVVFSSIPLINPVLLFFCFLLRVQGSGAVEEVAGPDGPPRIRDSGEKLEFVVGRSLQHWDCAVPTEGLSCPLLHCSPSQHYS